MRDGCFVTSWIALGRLAFVIVVVSFWVYVTRSSCLIVIPGGSISSLWTVGHACDSA